MNVDAGVRVTCGDLATGEKEVKVLTSSKYLIVTTQPMYVAHEQRYPKTGTVQLTLKQGLTL